MSWINQPSDIQLYNLGDKLKKFGVEISRETWVESNGDRVQINYSGISKENVEKLENIGVTITVDYIINGQKFDTFEELKDYFVPLLTAEQVLEIYWDLRKLNYFLKYESKFLGFKDLYSFMDPVILEQALKIKEHSGGEFKFEEDKIWLEISGVDPIFIIIDAKVINYMLENGYTNQIVAYKSHVNVDDLRCDYEDIDEESDLIRFCVYIGEDKYDPIRCFYTLTKKANIQ